MAKERLQERKPDIAPDQFPEKEIGEKQQEKSEYHDIAKSEEREKVILGKLRKSTSKDDDKQKDDQAISSAVKSDTRKNVEKIMQDNLADIYKSLNPEQQIEFKKKGAEVSSKIEVMIDTFKVRAKNVLELIREWLKIIPGVNKFFLEQETKLKTDKIMTYAKKRKKELKLKNKNKI